MTINRKVNSENLNDLKINEQIKESAKITNSLLDLISENIKPGITTKKLNDIAQEFIISKGAVSGFLETSSLMTEEKYTKSISISINNEVILNMLATDRILKDGDIVNVCSHIKYNGYYSNASRMFMVGNVSDKTKKLVKVTKECLDKGIEAIKPWASVADIINVIEEHAKNNGYSVFDKMGHILFPDVTKSPFLIQSNGENMMLIPGMIISLQPIITQGNSIFLLDDIVSRYYTYDGKLFAQWGSMILVTEDGIEILCK